MVIPRETEIFEIRITVAEKELPFWYWSLPAMNPDKNEDANQTKLGIKCREDLFKGSGLNSAEIFFSLKTHPKIYSGSNLIQIRGFAFFSSESVLLIRISNKWG
jgi:hypothetical protein